MMMSTRGQLCCALLVVAAGSAPGFAQGPRGEGGPQLSMMQISPILAAVDANHDRTISPEELAAAPQRLRSLDKNGDGILTRDEAGLTFEGRGRGPGGRGGGDDVPPIPGPTADELLATLLSYDKNADGRLERSEVPARMQGMFDRGDTNKDNVLDAAELRKLAVDQTTAASGGPGRGEGRGGFGRLDAAFNALDTDHNGEISADEIAHAAAALKALDQNGDGSITEDEVRPAFRGRDPGGQRPDEGR